MKVALHKKWTERLLGLPESGMGYQRVRVRLKDGRTIGEAIALNAQVLELPDGVPPFDPGEIADIELASPAR